VLTALATGPAVMGVPFGLSINASAAKTATKARAMNADRIAKG